MHSSSIILSLLPTLALAGPIAEAQPFKGQGIVATYRLSDGSYFGCVSPEGYWTPDETQCATVTGTVRSATVRLQTENGKCGTGVVDGYKGIVFICGEPLSQGLDYWEVFQTEFGPRLKTDNFINQYLRGETQAIDGGATNGTTIRAVEGSMKGIKFQLGWKAL